MKNNVPIRMSIMMSYVLRVNGKNGCKRMLISNRGGCMLETGNMNTERKKPKIMQSNKHYNNNFYNKPMMKMLYPIPLEIKNNVKGIVLLRHLQAP
jgi:hypothetical protein